MGPPIRQIGTDGGYLDAPAKSDPNSPKPNISKLVIMPGERADVIVEPQHRDQLVPNYAPRRPRINQKLAQALGTRARQGEQCV